MITGTRPRLTDQTQNFNKHPYHVLQYLATRPDQITAMTNKSLILTNVHLILTTLITSTHAFIDGPLHWVFAPNHTRGLACPSLRYGCC
jgi:hypothetical protein